MGASAVLLVFQVVSGCEYFMACRHGAVTVLGNGDPLMMSRYKIGPGDNKRAMHSVSNRAHLEAGFHKRYTKIANDFELVLFHYVTRSQNYFVENKISRRSGIYATTYAELQANDTLAGVLPPR